MKIVAAFLADSANVREGTLGVLSGFVNQFGRQEFPARFEVALVIVAETTKLAKGVHSYRGPLSFAIQHLDTGEEIAAGNGEIDVSQDADRSGYSPMVINLHDLLLPGPGTYEVISKVGSDSRRIRFYVDHI